MKVFKLARMMLVSSSRLNVYKYETDKKKRNKIIGGYVGQSFLYLYLVGLVLVSCVGYGAMGMTQMIPIMSGLAVSVMVFAFALFKAGAYMFGGNDYDFLMSLPFSVKDVVSAKFIYMYVNELPFVICLMISYEIGYGIYERPGLITYIIWTVLTFFLPVIPLIAATIICSFATGIGSRFKYKKIVSSIFMFIFILFCFSSRFIVEGLFRNNEPADIMNMATEGLESINTVYLPSKWFANAVITHGISDILLIVAASILVYELTFSLISKRYRQVNTRINSYGESPSKKTFVVKKRSVVSAVANNEFKRFLNSTNYLVNAGMGVVFISVLIVATLFVDMDLILAVMTQNAPIKKNILIATAPVIIYFFSGMVATTCISPSMEGKNMWILDTLPIKREQIIKGKMLFNIVLFLPISVLGAGILCSKLGANAGEALISVICVTAMVLFSTTFGMFMGLKFIRLDWTNDMEVIKKGAAVGLYLLFNMILTMLSGVVSVIVSFRFSYSAVMMAITIVYAVPAVIFYIVVMRKHG